MHGAIKMYKTPISLLINYTNLGTPAVLALFVQATLSTLLALAPSSKPWHYYNRHRQPSLWYRRFWHLFWHRQHCTGSFDTVCSDCASLAFDMVRYGCCPRIVPSSNISTETSDPVSHWQNYWDNKIDLLWWKQIMKDREESNRWVAAEIFGHC